MATQIKTVDMSIREDSANSHAQTQVRELMR